MAGADYTEQTTAGWVLTGGLSRRRGRDKALLPYRRRTLLHFVADEVKAVAGSVTLVGAPERYGHLGFTAVADAYPDFGPVGAIATLLESTGAAWNLVLACDMPLASWDCEKIARIDPDEADETVCPTRPVNRLPKVERAVSPAQRDFFTVPSRQRLAALMEQAHTAGAEAPVPVTDDGRTHPLCAVYHRRAAARFVQAVRDRSAKLTEVIESLDLATVILRDGSLCTNVNTPAEWAAARGRE
jgi:molybdopterin-guanine dinucleotide biosynthesis protein A